MGREGKNGGVREGANEVTVRKGEGKKRERVREESWNVLLRYT